MSIPLPNLDDRDFSDLMREVRALIPRYAPAWTNHNVSDPGITLLELLAWLSEATIYRINRSSDVSEARFLELLGASFSAARPAGITLSFAAEGLSQGMTLPRGTRVLADRLDGRPPLHFETRHDVVLRQQIVGSQEMFAGQVGCVQLRRIDNEFVGIATEKAFQHYFVSTDHVVPRNETELEPQISMMIDGTPWSYRDSLLDSGPNDRHFTVNVRTNRIYFGGGIGMIPPAGGEISISYKSTLGIIGELPIDTQFQLALDIGVDLEITRVGEFVEGALPTSLNEARYVAVDALRTKNRAITTADFEELLLAHPDFNLARAKCVAGVDLTATEGQQALTDHVSVIVVPKQEQDNHSTVSGDGVYKPAPTPEEIESIYTFLDERRLITCRHHVVGPTYVDVKIITDIVTNQQRSNDDVIDDLATNIKAFFHPLTGGPGDETSGWPFGRDVYLSEVYEVIENTSGVDHVENLVLQTRDESGVWEQAGEQIELGLSALVYLDIDSQTDIRIQDQY